MKDTRKTAKEWLDISTRTEFEKMLYDLKLTPREIEIVNLKYLNGKANYQIAMELSVSPETVRNDLSRVYDKIFRVLTK